MRDRTSTSVVVHRAELGRGNYGPSSAAVANRDVAVSSKLADLGNVVPFVRPGREGATVASALPSIAAGDRPAPALPAMGGVRRVSALAIALALHGVPLAMFWTASAPQPSIGTEVISIEVTLGANTTAGLATEPGQQEAQVAMPAEDLKPEDTVAERGEVTTVFPQDVQVALQETAPEVKEEQSEPPTPQQQPQEQQAETGNEQPVPQIKTAMTSDEQKRINAATQKEVAKKKRSAAAVPADAASGVGRGRSDVSANYNGTVATHLTRHKQYPVDARKSGAKGVATVSFTVDAGGRVTSVNLASGSGNAAIDQEVVAMVYRASPFPAPPDAQPRNFSVPVRFNLR